MRDVPCQCPTGPVADHVSDSDNQLYHYHRHNIRVFLFLVQWLSLPVPSTSARILPIYTRNADRRAFRAVKSLQAQLTRFKHEDHEPHPAQVNVESGRFNIRSIIYPQSIRMPAFLATTHNSDRRS